MMMLFMNTAYCSAENSKYRRKNYSGLMQMCVKVNGKSCSCTLMLEHFGDPLASY